ncbi:5453_t:CDS:10 [Diversispora eburnea]|uniref:5453_t:CDS:1 n=1 Tax=Diversispora eburnea TaxID=1213867 RepID=A0A9N8WBS4_9GLOM|nr:5453_t:CDS:10 [Diversispora eburnea]
MASNQQQSTTKPDIKVGFRLNDEYADTLMPRIRELLRCDSHSSHSNRFPGAQPVYLEKCHFKLLESEEYFVRDKTDGKRYIMFFTAVDGGTAFMLPLRNNHNAIHNETMMDGEIVMEIDNNKQRLRYLIFDLMVLNGSILIERPYNKRMGMLRQDVIEPLNAVLERNSDMKNKMPFSMEIKSMELSYGLMNVLQKAPSLKYGNDGLIFVPVNHPYQPENCDKLVVKTGKDKKPIYHLLISDDNKDRKDDTINHKFHDYLTLDPKSEAEWQRDSPDGIIGQFWYDKHWKTIVYDSNPYPRDGADTEQTLAEVWHRILYSVPRDTMEIQVNIIRDNWKQRQAKKSGNSRVVPSAPFLQTPTNSQTSYCPEPGPSLTSPTTLSNNSNQSTSLSDSVQPPPQNSCQPRFSPFDSSISNVEPLERQLTSDHPYFGNSNNISQEIITTTSPEGNGCDVGLRPSKNTKNIKNIGVTPFPSFQYPISLDLQSDVNNYEQKEDSSNEEKVLVTTTTENLQNNSDLSKLPENLLSLEINERNVNNNNESNDGEKSKSKQPLSDINENNKEELKDHNEYDIQPTTSPPKQTLLLLSSSPPPHPPSAPRISHQELQPLPDVNVPIRNPCIYDDYSSNNDDSDSVDSHSVNRRMSFMSTESILPRDLDENISKPNLPLISENSLDHENINDENNPLQLLVLASNQREMAGMNRNFIPPKQKEINNEANVLQQFSDIVSAQRAIEHDPLQKLSELALSQKPLQVTSKKYTRRESQQEIQPKTIQPSPPEPRFQINDNRRPPSEPRPRSRKPRRRSLESQNVIQKPQDSRYKMIENTSQQEFPIPLLQQKNRQLPIQSESDIPLQENQYTRRYQDNQPKLQVESHNTSDPSQVSLQPQMQQFPESRFTHLHQEITPHQIQQQFIESRRVRTQRSQSFSHDTRPHIIRQDPISMQDNSSSQILDLMRRTQFPEVRQEFQETGTFSERSKWDQN